MESPSEWIIEPYTLRPRCMCFWWYGIHSKDIPAHHKIRDGTLIHSIHSSSIAVLSMPAKKERTAPAWSGSL